MSKNDFETVSELRIQIARLVNEYNRLERIPFDTGLGDWLYPSELNTIEAIQTNKGSTVTEICAYFGITKGAVSQTVSKLIRKGYIIKMNNASNRREMPLVLTEKGKIIFNKHALFHQRMDTDMMELVRQYPEDRIGNFKQILSIIIRHIEGYNQLPDKHI